MAMESPAFAPADNANAVAEPSSAIFKTVDFMETSFVADFLALATILYAFENSPLGDGDAELAGGAGSGDAAHAAAF